MLHSHKANSGQIESLHVAFTKHTLCAALPVELVNRPAEKVDDMVVVSQPMSGLPDPLQPRMVLLGPQQPLDRVEVEDQWLLQQQQRAQILVLQRQSNTAAPPA